MPDVHNNITINVTYILEQSKTSFIDSTASGSGKREQIWLSTLTQSDQKQRGNHREQRTKQQEAHNNSHNSETRNMRLAPIAHTELLGLHANLSFGRLDMDARTPLQETMQDCMAVHMQKVNKTPKEKEYKKYKKVRWLNYHCRLLGLLVCY